MTKKIGLLSLTAIVVSSMIGSGIFSLPQNMAAVAGLEALLIGWLITGIGITFLALSFFFLSRMREDLDGGIYTYAQAGFGDLAGFFSAWGYWICASIGTVGYLVVIFEGLGNFVDTPDHKIFGAGNTIYAFIGESLLVWLIYWLIARGVKEAASVNLIGTIIKIAPLILFIVLGFFAFSPDQFTQDVKGVTLAEPTSIMQQVKDTMLITLWVFTGIEGASILSNYAEKKSDVGKATMLGLLIAMIVYLSVSILSYGILPRAEIAEMTNPSMGGILAHMMGDIGSIIITVCLILSVLVAYISWTLYATEVPYRGAHNGSFPKMMDKLNSNGTPINALLFSSLIIQVCLVLVLFTGEGYETLLELSTSMILVPYSLIGAYLLKLSIQRNSKWYIKLTGLMSTLYGLWVVYAAGLNYLLLSALIYAPGIGLYLYSRYEHNNKSLHLTNHEKIILALSFVLFICSAYYFTIQ